MRKKSLLAVAVCTAALAGVNVSAALGSEVIGPPGSHTPNLAAKFNANSICTFSGLNDGNAPGGIVQSYGYSFVSRGDKATVPSPGDTVEAGGCRGGSNPYNPPGS